MIFIIIFIYLSHTNTHTHIIVIRFCTHTSSLRMFRDTKRDREPHRSNNNNNIKLVKLSGCWTCVCIKRECSLRLWLSDGTHIVVCVCVRSAMRVQSVCSITIEYRNFDKYLYVYMYIYIYVRYIFIYTGD